MSKLSDEMLQRILYIGDVIPNTLVDDERPKFILLGTPQEFIDAVEVAPQGKEDN